MCWQNVFIQDNTIFLFLYWSQESWIDWRWIWRIPGNAHDKQSWTCRHMCCGHSANCWLETSWFVFLLLTRGVFVLWNRELMNQFLRNHQLNKAEVDETDESISVWISGLQDTFLYSFPSSYIFHRPGHRHDPKPG